MQFIAMCYEAQANHLEITSKPIKKLSNQIAFSNARDTVYIDDRSSSLI
jgi:hypothetical protein